MPMENKIIYVRGKEKIFKSTKTESLLKLHCFPNKDMRHITSRIFMTGKLLIDYLS